MRDVEDNSLKKKMMLNQNKIQREMAQYLQKLLPIYSWYIQNDELYLYIPSKMIEKVMYFLKNHSMAQYKILTDIAGVDYPARGSFRFDIVYHLLSIRYNSRISVKICVNDSISVPTITTLFSNADWSEREVFDMYGIQFKSHPDLRRILTDYGFKGHPLRKDFPLIGFYELKYDNIKLKMLYESIELEQNPKMELHYSPS